METATHNQQVLNRCPIPFPIPFLLYLDDNGDISIEL
jgi:hypothetical protein